MAKTYTAPFTQNINQGFATIQPADTTTMKTVFTAGAEGSKIVSLSATNDDSAAAYVLEIYKNNGSVDIFVGAVNIPLNSGKSGSIPSVDLKNATIFPHLPYDASGNKIMLLQAGHTLKVKSQTTVNSGKTVTIIATGEDF